MNVHFTPEQEAQLSELAAHEGLESDIFVKNAALRLLEDDARSREAVRQGLAQVADGATISHEEVGERLEK